MRITDLNRHLDKLFPEGIEVPNFTLIGGPGGSGKPLLSFIYVMDWLKYGGKVIYVATSTSPEFVRKTTALLKLGDISSFERKRQIGFLNVRHSERQISETEIQAYMADPEVFRSKISEFDKRLSGDFGTMLAIPALNLLFMNRETREELFQIVLDFINKRKEMTFVFTINEDVFRNMSDQLKRESDIFMETFMEQKKIAVLVKKATVPFSHDKVLIDFGPEVLMKVKEEADARRKKITELK